MALSGSDIAQRVIHHLLEITAGDCSITHAMIEAEGEDRAVCEILTGLLYLHEDLVLRAKERERAEDELRAVVERLANQNTWLAGSGLMNCECSHRSAGHSAQPTRGRSTECPKHWSRSRPAACQRRP